MPKITSVEPQQKDYSRFNIFIDGEFVFGADEDLVVEKRLVAGKEISKEDLEKLLFEAEVGKLLQRLYSLLKIRPRSEKEIRDYLINLSFKRKVKGKEEISAETVELTLNKLKQKKLLSDEEFAAQWVESRRRSKQKGKMALKAELFQKGIDRETVEEVVGESTEEDEKVLAKQALEKKLKSWKNLDEQELKQKATEFLLRRGFEYEVVKEVVREVIDGI